MLAGAADSLTGGLYLNFLGGEDRRNAAVRAVGEEALKRLAHIKSEVDPNNVFDHGVDITE